MDDNTPSIFAGALIGFLSTLGGVYFQTKLAANEKRSDQFRSRGQKIEELINEYERAGCRYWSLTEPEKEEAQKINALRQRIGSEIAALARKKINCRHCEVLLTLLHKATTLHDSFNTASCKPDNIIVLKIQAHAEDLRYSLRDTLDII